MGFEFSVMPGRIYNVSNVSDLQKVIGDSPVTFPKTPANVSKGMVEWLCGNKVGNVLASPNIVTVSGRPAEFCVGGEIPIPGHGGSPAAVDFQKFGTEVSLLACALGDDRVRLEIRTRVSELDESHKLPIGNSVVPAFKVRSLGTAFESKFNQSTVLCGGIENRTEMVRKVGEDGTSKIVEENNEVGLVVIVTPEAVDPYSFAEDGGTITK
jgi:Flp pilus assembly secretin CpaC